MKTPAIIFSIGGVGINSVMSEERGAIRRVFHNYSRCNVVLIRYARFVVVAYCLVLPLRYKSGGPPFVAERKH